MQTNNRPENDQQRQSPPVRSRHSRSSERGSVTIMTAVLLVGLVGVMGLSIDVSRVYMVRAGLQNAADAAALAAARELNSGTGGLADAVAQAKAVALQANKYGFNRTGNTAPNVTISKVEFSSSLAANATWYDNTNGNNVPAGQEASIKYVRVTTQSASVSILFAAQALGASRTEQRSAIAGASVGLNGVCFFPVAVALTDLTIPVRQLTFTFADGTGSSVSLANLNYVVLNVPGTPGQGSPETANQAAGGTPLCGSVGDSLIASNSNSANATNGPKQIADGANTRFDTYTHGYANDLNNPTTYPPDTNVYDNNGNPLTAAQYVNRSPFSPPPRNPPGQDNRRIMVMPIVTPGTYNSSSITIRKFGAFLLRKSVRSNGAGAGDLVVEYLGDTFVLGRGSYDGDTTKPSSNLSIPVLYR